MSQKKSDQSMAQFVNEQRADMLADNVRVFVLPELL